MSSSIPRRERDAILNSLGAGVVPAIGLPHVQVGRVHEVSALVEDLKRIEEGGAAIRFVVGRFGSGKSFFLNLVRAVALERKFVVAQADVTLERRLHASNGKARNLFRELMANLATRGRPEGGALTSLVDRWISDVSLEVQQAGGGEDVVQEALAEALKPLLDDVGGYDLLHVVTAYYQAFLGGDDDRREAAARWMRAEYATKTEAREALGVRTIIDDQSWYDFLKLFAKFVRQVGYAGLLVSLDELVVLSHRLNNATARNNNYEKILQILNDCLQGGAEGIGVLFAGTDDCLEDTRRGLFSYEALATRLQPNRFAKDGLRDLAGPVIALESLTEEECYVLLTKIRDVHAGEFELPDEALHAFLSDCKRRLGAEYFQTPRDTIKAFIGLLRVLEQNPEARWQDLLDAAGADAEAAAQETHAAMEEEATIVEDAAETDAPPAGESDRSEPADGADDDLASFRL